jgi:tRNA uridine 5-carboxymethylaminomethyl modification enzyme
MNNDYHYALVDMTTAETYAFAEVQQRIGHFAYAAGLGAMHTYISQAEAHRSNWIARPQLTIKDMAEILPQLKAVLDEPANRKEEIAEAAEVNIKYKGYIERERLIADKMHRLENIKIKGRFNYSELHEISTEGRQKLERIDPETLAQASRIPGVSPSDINVLLVLLGR